MTEVLLENVNKSFGEVLAVKDITLHIKEGKVVGLLGPNGAGKSTIIKIITGLLNKDSGSVKFIKNEHIIKNPKKKIGLLFGGEQGLYRQLSAKDNLLFFGSLYGIEKKILIIRIRELLDKVGLDVNSSKMVKDFSKGMKQRLHIARVLLNDPDILILDEPTLGLDIEGTSDLRTIILNQKKKGKSILLTTHDLEEAQELCDEINFLIDGEIKDSGSFEYFKNKYEKENKYKVYFLTKCDEINNLFENIYQEDIGYSIEIKDLSIFNKVLELNDKIKIKGIESKSTSLKEIYLSSLSEFKK